MNQARIFSVAVAAVVLGVGTLGFYGLPRATFQGDLTRMSIMPERLFGWTLVQPTIEPQLMQQSSLKDADVLVIGDSFSNTRLWQSVLVKKGLKVRTEVWTSGQLVCADTMAQLRKQGFAGRYVVMESVERDLLQHVRNSLACTSKPFGGDAQADTPRTAPAASFDVYQGNYLGSISTGLKVLWNTAAYHYKARSPEFKSWTLNQNVQISRVPNGCELFSHASCQDSLFLTWDKPDDIDVSVLAGMEKINARLPGVTPVWVVVPNRSTAYLYPDKKFWEAAEQRVRAPNLLRMTQQAIEAKKVDLYPANNTHFSTEGHLMMGEATLAAMTAAPTPAKP